METFTTFFEGWLNRQENFLDQLHLAAAPENEYNIELQRSLIYQVLSHYQEYYEEKAIAAQENIFPLFCPPWLNSLERVMLWLGGFKPSVVFSIVNSSVRDLTPEQTQRMEILKNETMQEERQLMEAHARLEEILVTPRLLNLVWQFGMLINGEVSELESLMEEWKSSMIIVLETADVLRGRTVRRTVEILSPFQTVKFLAGVVEYHLRIRRWGLRRDSERTAAV